MYGNLTLEASQAPQLSLRGVLPVTKNGAHTQSRYSGHYELATSTSAERAVLLPSRGKEVQIYLEGQENTADYWHDVMETIDSSPVGDTWLQKVEHYRKACADAAGALMVNVTSAHGNITLISHTSPIYMAAVFDQQLNTVNLVWGMTDVVSLLRSAFPMRYCFYRFPEIVNTSVFIPVQIVCAHWWRYRKSADVLFALNALELKLFKLQTWGS